MERTVSIPIGTFRCTWELWHKMTAKESQSVMLLPSVGKNGFFSCAFVNPMLGLKFVFKKYLNAYYPLKTIIIMHNCL